MAFYTSETDGTLNGEMVLTDVDVFISKIILDNIAGVETEASNDITLSPAVSPSYVADAYNSTATYNLQCQADTSIVAIGKVKDTLTTGIVFDATAMYNVATGVALAAADWATASTYNYTVMTPGSTYVHGDYFGYCKGVSTEMNQEIIEFTKGVPIESIVEDTKRMNYTVKGENFAVSNQDVWEAVMNSTQRGLNTSQWESHGGFTPPVRSFYRVTLVGSNRNGKVVTLQYFRGQFRTEGSIDWSSEEYKKIGWTLAVKKDSMRPDAYNAYSMQVDE